MIIVLAIGLTWIAGSASRAALVDFELEPLGTLYGTPAGHSPGDVVFFQNNVQKVTLKDFTLGPFTGFNFAEIAVPPKSFFSSNLTQALTINNINIEFDLTNAGFDVTFLSFEYADAGGDENFDINMTGRQEVSAFSALAPIPNFSVSVTATPFGGGVEGVVEITASPGNRIENVLIGGQELTIDNLRFVPEPSSLVLLALGVIAVGWIPRSRNRKRRDRHAGIVNDAKAREVSGPLETAF